MKTQLHLPNQILLTVAIIFFSALCLITHETSAQEKCVADFTWEPDANNPLLIHFCGGGYFGHNSFSYTCSWDFGDGGNSIDSCPNHTYAMPGIYHVCQDAGMCVGGGMSCHDTVCKDISVGMPSVINETKSGEYELNYVASTKTITIKSNQNLRVTIINPTGSLIQDIYTEKNFVSIDLSRLSGGLYFYSVSSNSGKSLGSGKLLLN